MEHGKQLSLFEFETPSMPVLDVSRCKAKIINYQTAKNMVETHHYAHRVPSIVIAVGMYVDDVLSGCVTYGIPPNRNCLACCGEEHIKNALELNRLFIHDWAGRNSESWLIGQSFKILIDTSYYLLISYADPIHDHTGYIYQATNWLYTGTGSASAPSDAIVNGQRMSEKNIFNIYGTHNRDKLKEIGLDIIEIERLPKHRYVYFLGSKSQKRTLRKLLKWPILPYPKKVF